MKKISLIVAVVLAFASCTHITDDLTNDTNNNGGNGGGSNPIEETDCDPSTVYFANTIAPLLQSNCAQSGCHDQATMEDGVGMFSYDVIMQQVSPGNPGGSDLWEAITENDPDDIMPPIGEGSLTAEEINLITTWIQQGAQNNSCTSDCDPNVFTFAAVIMPTVQTYCQGCHSGGNPDGGLSLTNYTQVQAIALDGSLMHSLHGTGGYVAMPYQSNALSDCRIQQFQSWVDAGAPNN